jgi:double zinc ribbon protein
VIVCTGCGHQNDGDADFCASCGEPLEWTGEPVEEPAGEPAEATPAAAGVANESAESTSTVRARQPAQEAERRPPRPAPPPAALGPSDVFCTSCGTGNRAEARFCRRCGASLANAVAAHVPWWRRIFRRRRRPPVAAGERPGWRMGSQSATQTTAKRHRGLPSFTGKVFLLLALAGIVGVVAVNPWRDSVTSRVADAYGSIRRTLFPHFESVVPTKATASSGLRGHPPRLAIDENKSTFWAEGARGNGRGQTLVVHFAASVDLARIGFTVGNQSAPQDFVREPTPRRVRLVFVGPGRRVVDTQTVTLQHTPKFQPFAVDARHVRRVRVRIESVYPSEQGHAAALTEVEFWSKH